MTIFTVKVGDSPVNTKASESLSMPTRFYNEGSKQLKRGFSYLKEHKIAVSLTSLAAAGLVCYLNRRDKEAPTHFSYLIHPVEQFTNQCFTDMCKNSVFFKSAMDSNDLEKMLSIKGPFRKYHEGVFNDYGRDFNTKTTQMFLDKKNIEPQKHISVLKYFNHPMYREGQSLYAYLEDPLYDSSLHPSPFEHLISEEMLNLSQDSHNVTLFAKNLKQTIDRLTPLGTAGLSLLPVVCMHEGRQPLRQVPLSPSLKTIIEILEQETDVKFYSEC